MRKITKQKSIFLVLIGTLTISLIQVFTQYAALPDSIRGLLTGIGIGMLLIALISGKSKSASN
ncbi:hypothetical protein GTQ40_17365 [Flavobacteriaceae bacterium R38]|nr:hypothetical protein [Flavobacteriaceae bacterium R38]